MQTSTLVIIVVVALVLVALVFVLLSSASRSAIVHTFTVTTTTNGKSGNVVFVVDGVQKPDLILARGSTYRFSLLDQSQPFYFTTSSAGGPGAPGNLFPQNTPTAGTNLDITVDNALPCSFFYQGTTTTNMGGSITVNPC